MEKFYVDNSAKFSWQCEIDNCENVKATLDKYRASKSLFDYLSYSGPWMKAPCCFEHMPPCKCGDPTTWDYTLCRKCSDK